MGVLGVLQVDGSQAVRPRSKSVLAALAVRRGQLVEPDELAEAVWAGDPPRSWPKQVQYCIWELRRALGAGAIETVDGAYRLAADVELDAAEFEAMVERGRTFAATGEPDRAASTLTKALELWRGRPFGELDGWMPGRQEAGRLEELRRSAEEEVIEARLAAGDHRDVVGLAGQRASEEPLRERRWALLALSHYRCGNQADALRALRQARRVLIEELGLEPSPELVALEAAILGQDPVLEGPPTIRSVADRCPYKGLAAYEADDADVFFGRDAEITTALERLDSVRLLAVAGPSGSGKSSLVRAGIVPALRRRGHAVVVVVPGADPETALAHVLGASTGDPIVVVDQLEEVYAGHQHPDSIAAFCARLAVYAAERAQVVVTIRSDHLGHVAAEATMARLVEQGLHLVGPIRGDALRETIERPATAAGLRLESGLVDLLVREVEGEAAGLPLLSHALAETWERRDGRVLTVEGYRATGEIRGAVARSAEQLYASLPPEHQAKLKSLLLRLVVPAADGEPVRAHLARRRLEGDAGRERVLDLLARARLVTADESSVELAHEAVARAWPRLRAWLEEDVAGQRLVHHLATAAEEWDTLGRPDSELYRGARLDAAVEWRDSQQPELTVIESAFLDASAAAADSDRRALLEQTHRQARQNRRLRWALIAAGVLLVAAVSGGLVARAQRTNAQAGRRQAALSALVGDSMALRSNRRDVAALLAVEAYRLEPNAETESALFATFTKDAGAERVIATGAALDILGGDGAFLPDGRTVVVADDFGALRLVNIETGAIAHLPALSDRVGYPHFAVAADGRYVAAAWRDYYDADSPSVVVVWDVETRTQRFEPITIPFGIGEIAITPDGSMIAVSGGEEMRALTFDGETGAPRAELEPLTRPDEAHNRFSTAGLAFAPDGRLAVGSQAGVLRVVDPATGEELQRYEGPIESSSGFVAFLDGVRSILTTGSEVMRRIDATTGEVQWEQPERQCNSMAIAERIGTLLCGEWSGRVVAYDLETGFELGDVFDGQHGNVCGLAVSPDGAHVVATTACNSLDVKVVAWRVDGGGPISRLVSDVTDPGYIGYRPSASDDALLLEYPDRPDALYRAHFLDSNDDQELASYDGIYGFEPTDDPAVAAVIYDDGQSAVTFGLFDTRRNGPAGPVVDPGEFDNIWTNGRVAMILKGGDPEAGRNGELRTYDLSTGRRVDPTITGFPWWIEEIVFADDQFYTVNSDQTTGGRDRLFVQRHDLHSGEVLAETGTLTYNNVALKAGVLVAATNEGAIVELDPVTLEQVGAPFPGANGAVAILALDTDARRLMVRAKDESLRFYDVATRTQLGDAIDTDTGFEGAAFRSDGLAAAAVTRHGVVAWDLDPARWVEAACELTFRNLTRAEWDRYIGDLAEYRETCPRHPSGE